MSTTLHRWLFRLAAASLLALGPALRAQDLDLGGGGDDDFEIQLDEEPPNDYENLRLLDFSELSQWPMVASQHARWNNPDKTYLWQEAVVTGYGDRLFVKPLGKEAITNLIAVPEAATYRVWLCYVGETKRPHPVTLRFSGANEAEHVFGAKPLPNLPAGQVRKKTPFRFEGEVDRMAFQMKPVAVWEYVDLPLKAGQTTVAVSTDDMAVRVDSLVISLSKTFVPSKSATEGESTLTKTYYRYRVLDPQPAAPRVNIKSFIHYMWAHYRPNNPTNDIWYSSMGSFVNEAGSGDLAPGEWTTWKDCTEQVTNQGKYFADKLTITNAKTRDELEGGTVEVQLAWFQHDAAVLRTLSNPIAYGWTRYLVPVARPDGYKSAFSEAGATEGVWGARSPEYIDRLLSERMAMERLMASIDQSDLVEGVMPKRIRIFTSCATAESAYDVAIPLLKRVGVNAVQNIPFRYKTQYGLQLPEQLYNQSGTVFVHSHDPLDPIYERELYKRCYGPEALAKRIDQDPEFLSRPNWLKMGDEIGRVTTATHVNGLPDDRAAYLEYMRGVANNDPSFFGVTSFDQLWYASDKEPGRRRAERRLFYHNQEFIWWLTSKFYERHTRAAQRAMPNIRTRCNYSPGSCMFAGSMDGGNWFALPRHGACTAHSAEDWLGRGGYTSHAGTQTEAYYGALVECGARTNPGMPLDFIMVGRSQELDRKFPILVGSHITQVNLYDWGPEFTRGAVDTWSNVLTVYGQANRAARCVGGAEDIILDGQRTPYKAAILYNRTNEIWNGGEYAIFSDRLYTYVALRHSHHNPDLLLEDDLTPDQLKAYDILYLDGINLRRDVVPAIKAWVEQGGILYAAAGTAMRDQYDDPLPEAAELLGATQQVAGTSDGNNMAFYIPQHEPIDVLSVKEGPLTPAVEANVVGLKTVLTPTTGESIATYKDGSCGGVYHRLGKGQVLLLGIEPGLSYSNHAPRDADSLPTTYTAIHRELITKAAGVAIGLPVAEHSEPLVDVTLFESKDAIAVIIVDFTWKTGTPGTLTVRTKRKITSVSGTLHGPYQFKREGDAIVVDCPTPSPSDIVILK